MSLASLVGAGSELSVTHASATESDISIFGMPIFGSSLSIRSFRRLGSSCSGIGHAVFDRAIYVGEVEV